MTVPDGADSGAVDFRVEDPALLEEIHLYSELIIVAANSPEQLSAAAIDRALGVENSASTG